MVSLRWSMAVGNAFREDRAASVHVRPAPCGCVNAGRGSPAAHPCAVGERAHIVCAPLSAFFGHRSPLPKGTPKRSALLRAESGADMDAQ